MFQSFETLEHAIDSQPRTFGFHSVTWVGGVVDHMVTPVEILGSHMQPPKFMSEHRSRVQNFRKFGTRDRFPAADFWVAFGHKVGGWSTTWRVDSRVQFQKNEVHL